MRRGPPGSGFASTSGRTSYEPPGTACHDHRRIFTKHPLAKNIGLC